MVAVRFGKQSGIYFEPGEAEATARFFAERTDKAAAGKFVDPAHWRGYEDGCTPRTTYFLDLRNPLSGPDDDGPVGPYDIRKVAACVGGCEGRKARCRRNPQWRDGDPVEDRCECYTDPTII